MPLDVVLAGPGLETQLIERARPIALGDHAVPFIALPDLIVTKLLAGRPRDLEDVRSLLAHRDDLDLTSVRATLEEIERALDQPDLSPQLARLLPKPPRKKRSRRRT